MQMPPRVAVPLATKRPAQHICQRRVFPAQESTSLRKLDPRRKRLGLQAVQHPQPGAPQNQTDQEQARAMKKKCSLCLIDHSTTMFYKDKTKLDNLHPWCKNCHKEKNKKYYQDNKQKILGTQHNYYEKIKEVKKDSFAKRRRDLYWSNPEKYRKLSLSYIKKNPVLNAKRTADYRSRQLRAIPIWYDNKKVKEIYEFAAEFRLHGFDVDVDHIVPLKNSKVCGLHVHDNLRVCLLSINRMKSNKHEEKI